MGLACACGDGTPVVNAPTAVEVPDVPAASSTAPPSATESDADAGPGDTAPARIKVTFTLVTEGARVHLVRGDDVRQLPMFPITVAFDSRQSWTLRAKKPGFCELVVPLDPQNGPVQRVDIELKPGCL
jgi:hypothetical protein